MTYDRILFANGAQSRLLNSMAASSAVTTMTLVSGGGSLFPSITSPGDYFVLSVMSVTGVVEVMKCTARTGDVLTVVRGWEYTTILGLAADCKVAMAPTAGTMQQLQAAGWSRELSAVAYGSATTFTVLTDQTLKYVATRRLRLTQTTNGFADVIGSSFSGGYTTVIINSTTSAVPVDSGLTGVDLGPEVGLIRPLASAVDVKTINGQSMLGAGDVTVATAGISKYTNLAAILAIGSPGADDYAVAQDTGMTYQYHGGQWVTAFNNLVNPMQGGGWVLAGTLSFNGTVPTGAFDISGCDRFRVEIQQTAIAGGTGYSYLNFGSDTTAANYLRQGVQSNGTIVTYVNNTAIAGFPLANSAAAYMGALEFCKSSKTGVFQQTQNSSGLYAFFASFQYTGADAMNTLTIYGGTQTMTGSINVYRWMQQSVPLQMASYQLVKEYTPSNAVLNDTIAWDGQTDDILYAVGTTASGAVYAPILLECNGDTTAANYQTTQMYGNGTTVGSSNNQTYAGIMLGQTATVDEGVFTTTVSMKSGYGARKAVNESGNALYTHFFYSKWLNSASPITSIRIHSGGVAMTGNIKIYKIAQSILVSTNPNLMTAWQKYTDANTVTVQPGEIEINGAICTVSKPTAVTLSGHLEAGISEAPSTVFYLYAIRGMSNTLTYMFSTTAPLMDRYGNTVASFELCDSQRAWFHPTKGTMYRYIGQVLNDSSSNILAFDKCLPGNWESAWTSCPTYGAYYAIGHGFGRISGKPVILYKTGIADITYGRACAYFNNSGTPYGATAGFHRTSTIPQITTSAVCVLFAANAFVETTLSSGGSWVTSGGYYKIIFTET